MKINTKLQAGVIRNGCGTPIPAPTPPRNPGFPVNQV